MMEETFNFHYPSPLGLLNIFFTTRGIIRIDFTGDEENIIRSPLSQRKTCENCKLILQQFNEYFTGKRKEFDFPLILKGTEFQIRVWQELLKIPYGETRTYSEIARSIGNSGAARAVGMASSKNPLPIIIPCHRVIGADGGLTGYAGSLWRKRWLLEHEKNIERMKR
ncbi:MAG: methylated-DNA-[protein]-cysteine S-methyltransferase [Halanaerobiales bacterium]|nr:methylated-DNA-[protein]-cysteine S-methyltransferase [Halanaerobiales bacterium]